MSRRLSWCCVSLLALPSLGPAQTWSVTASAPVAGTAFANYFYGFPMSQNATLPIGAVAPGVYLAANSTVGSVGAAASASWSPGATAPAATVGFTARTSASLDLGFGSVCSASLIATLDFTLTAPQPVGGRLWVRRVGVQPSSTADLFELDVGADGTVELRIDASTPDTGPIEVPFVIGVGGAVVRVLGQTVTTMIGPPVLQTSSTNMGVEVQFFPGQPAVQSFDSTGAGALLSFVHALDNTLTLSIGGLQQTPLVMAIGSQPVSIPVLPTVTVLVSLDLVLSTSSITVVPPPLPPGIALYVQGLIADSGGILRSTNSVRVLWP